MPPSYQQIIPYSSIYIDIHLQQLKHILPQFFKPDSRENIQKEIQQIFLHDKQKERLFVTSSVRSSTDLALQALDFPNGSEIIITGINIPDMVKVLRFNGMVPVPIEIDLARLAPKLEDFKKVYNEKTKAIMVSFLYGARFDAEEIYKWAKEKGLFIFEDEAESFNGLDRNGSKQAHLSMFSFGTIQPYTSFGGSLAVLRMEDNDALFKKMTKIQDAYPLQPNSFFVQKIIKNLAVILALNNTTANKNIKYLSNLVNFDYKQKVVSMVRGFQPEGDFLSTFRKQIPIPMMALLSYRLKNFDKKAYQIGLKNLLIAQNYLEKNGVRVPGFQSDDRGFWLFPIIVPDIMLCYKMLNERGVDAYLGATQLKIVDSPIGSKYEYPENTYQFFKDIIYLPINPTVPMNYISTMIKETVEVCQIVTRIKESEQSKAQVAVGLAPKL